MIVYGSRTYVLDPSRFFLDVLRRIERTPAAPVRDDIVDLFVDFGEAYSAIADRLMPQCDDVCAALAPWSGAMQRIADALCAHWHGDVAKARVALASVGSLG